MLRRLSALTLLAALIAAQVGCRSRCDRPGLLSSSNTKGPCQTVGRAVGCYDGVTGQPCPCPPGVPATVVPGVGPGTYPDPYPAPRVTPGELPMPGPSDLIQPPPAAIPLPAPPPPPGSGGAVLPPPVSPGVPVKK